VRPDLSAPSEQDVEREVAAFLSRQHYTLASSNQFVEGKVIIRAGAGACRVVVANANPIAWDRDIIDRNATAADHVFTVFRGRIYQHQPTWLTVPYFLWARLQRQLGLGTRTAPLLAVIAAPSCNAERLPWSELS
jgi:hypothetical protein